MTIKVIAEIGSVHDGSFGNSKKLIDIAKECGADYVKFQYHIAKNESLKGALNPKYFQEEKRYDYFERTSFTLQQWKELIKYTKQKKIKFLCSIFSIESFKNLLSLGVKSFKIPSGEVSNLPMLLEVSKYRDINIFLSTGMSDFKEIEEAYKILKRNNLTIMQCTSQYPCEDKRVGLNIFDDFKKKFKDCILGFSDHTQNDIAAILAVSKGSKYFEKHLTFSKKMYGSDAKFASEPHEFINYCKSLKKAEIIIQNKVDKNDLKPFRQMRKVFQKSIVFNSSFKKGQKINMNMLNFMKPDKGVSAKNFRKILGKKLNKNVKANSYVRIRDLKN
jgi:N,N'-diacetyllegionaminate synthase